jgi:hypothetical protein
MRPLGRIGSEIFVRTAALYGSFLVASAVVARIGDDSLGAAGAAIRARTNAAPIPPCATTVAHAEPARPQPKP